MAGIPFKREVEFEYGQVDRVSPLIRRVIAEKAHQRFTDPGNRIAAPHAEFGKALRRGAGAFQRGMLQRFGQMQFRGSCPV